MTLSQFLRTLAARRKIILVTIVTLLVLLAIVILVVPPKYTATATVVVSSEIENPIAGTVTEMPIMSTLVLTQVDVINSARVARKVVEQLKLAQQQNLIDLWRDDTGGKGDIVDWIGNLLQLHLKVKPGRDSNVIEINYTSPDPKFAAVLANAFTEQFLKSSAELRIEPARLSSQFFDVRINELRSQLEAAQARLAAAQKDTNVVVTPERLDVENARLADLSSQLVLAQGLKADSTSRSIGAQGNVATSPDVIQNGVVQQLQTAIALQQSKLKELSGSLGPNHPQYIAAQQDLADLEGSLARAQSQVGSSLNTASRVGVDRVAQLQAAVDAQRQRIIDLSQKRDQLSVLQREVDNADKAYQLVMERYAQTNLESHVAQADVALLSSAAEPTDPSFPRIKLYVALTIIFGVFLGIGLALLAEVFDPMIHGPADVAQGIGIPVFAMVPALKSRRARFWSWFQRLRRNKSDPRFA